MSSSAHSFDGKGVEVGATAGNGVEVGGLGVLVGAVALPEQPATASMRPRPASAHSQYFIVLSFPKDTCRITGPMDKDG
jgi:hypothetical protein